MDLAGHGHSGMSRSIYSMRAFGEDVRAVVEAVGSPSVILIGHSMGGIVIAEAARLMPGRVIGLIGIDTLSNIEYPMTQPELENMLAPIKKDFREGTRQFVSQMFLPETSPELREWVLADMASAPARVGISAMQEMMNLYVAGETAKLFDAVRLPVITVNGDLWPVDEAANRRHMLSFQAVILRESDHFLMMARPDKFNKALAQAIEQLMGK